MVHVKYNVQYLDLDWDTILVKSIIMRVQLFEFLNKFYLESNKKENHMIS